MSSRPHALRSAPWLLLALGLWACRGSGPASAPPAAGKRYTVRAEVVALPAPPGHQLMLRHEAIPDFTDRSGAVVGMSSMTMPFPVGTDVSLAGLAAGDKVEVVFAVDWGRGKYEIERLEKLPAETALRFEKAPAMGATGSASDPPSR